MHGMPAPTDIVRLTPYALRPTPYALRYPKLPDIHCSVNIFSHPSYTPPSHILYGMKTDPSSDQPTYPHRKTTCPGELLFQDTSRHRAGIGGHTTSAYAGSQRPPG